MRRSLPFCLSIVAAIHSAALQAKTIELEPNTKWHVFYEEDNCQLARVFGTAPNEVLLSFRQASPRSPMQPSISGKPIKSLFGTANGLKIAFGKDAAPVPVDRALQGEIGPERKPLLILTPVDFLNRSIDDRLNDKSAGPEATTMQLAAISHIKFVRGGSTIVLHVDRMDSAMKALGLCTTDLVKMWGLDPVQQATLATAPSPLSNPGGWATSSDYPVSALRVGQSASVQFRLMIDKTGVPTDCKVQSATQGPAFIALTCSLLMKRARFKPATTTDGSPVESYYTNTVNWLIPSL